MTPSQSSQTSSHKGPASKQFSKNTTATCLNQLKANKVALTSRPSHRRKLPVSRPSSSWRPVQEPPPCLATSSPKSKKTQKTSATRLPSCLPMSNEPHLNLSSCYNLPNKNKAPPQKWCPTLTPTPKTTLSSASQSSSAKSATSTSGLWSTPISTQKPRTSVKVNTQLSPTRLCSPPNAGKERNGQKRSSTSNK